MAHFNCSLDMQWETSLCLFFFSLLFVCHTHLQSYLFTHSLTNPFAHFLTTWPQLSRLDHSDWMFPRERWPRAKPGRECASRPHAGLWRLEEWSSAVWERSIHWYSGAHCNVAKLLWIQRRICFTIPCEEKLLNYSVFVYRRISPRCAYTCGETRLEILASIKRGVVTGEDILFMCAAVYITVPCLCMEDIGHSLFTLSSFL